MTSGLTIIRRPYEEPYHLNLIVRAADEHQSAELEIYCNADDLMNVARSLRTFPKHRGHVFQWELGSEQPEDRFGFYFRLGFRQVSARGDCLVEVRFNNNEDPPDRRISEFSFPAFHFDLERLAAKFKHFSGLGDKALEWTVAAATDA